MEFFIVDKSGQQAGPYSLEQLAQLAITPKTLVWRQGMEDWAPAWKVEDLRTTLEAAEAIRVNQAQQQGVFSQEDLQQAQQAAYQQGFQHGAAMNQPQEKKKSSKIFWKMILALLVILLLILTFTNPSVDDHKGKVRTEVNKVIEQVTRTSDNNIFNMGISFVAKMMAGNMMDDAMDQLFEYHNYIICSKGSVEFNGKEHTVSFGILGRVYTINSEDIVKALQENNIQQLEVTTSTSSDSDINKDENKTNEDESDDTNSVQQKLEYKFDEMCKKVIDKILELL